MATKWIAMTHHMISISTHNLRDFTATVFSTIIQKFGYHLFKKHAGKVFALKTETGKTIKRYLVLSGISPLKIEYVLNGWI